MFTHQQIEHFKAFGFVVLRGLLADSEARTLKAEVAVALTDAFGGQGTDDDAHGAGGIRGDYLPLALDRTPFSQALIADDPRLFQGSAELLGQTTLPAVPIATCFTRNAGPTVWCGGRIIGGWAQRKDTGEVVSRLLEDAGTEVSAAVEAEAARLTEWLGDVRITPRFPTPLQRQLAR